MKTHKHLPLQLISLSASEILPLALPLLLLLSGCSKPRETQPDAKPQAALETNSKPSFKNQLAKAEKGNADAQFAVAVVFYEGKEVEKDYSEAIKWYRKAAEQEFPLAQLNLGLMFVEGEGAPQNYTEAIKWVRKAADQGLARAQYQLGAMSARGEGLPQDFTEAYKWFILADAQGDEYAKQACAKTLQFLSSEQITESHQRATGFEAKILSKTQPVAVAEMKQIQAKANKGDAEAQFKIGVNYYSGQGVPQSFSEGVRWVRKAADQGYAKAQCYLGDCYGQGLGVPQDQAEQKKLYLKAAEQGDADGQFRLAIRYYFSLGEPRDLVEAYKWVSLSAAQGGVDEKGSKVTVGFRGKLLLEMTPEQTAEGQRQAAAFVPKKN